MGYKDNFLEWKKSAQDAEIAAELLSIEHNDAEIKNRFSEELCFGTAGLRGKIGAGTNRMNVYTVGRASQGLAKYVLDSGGQDKGMIIAYDTRKNSQLFSETTALVFAASGIKTYLFEEATSVPELSFAIKSRGVFGGVAITASHNPKDYNGYKVYAPWGGQILADISEQVTSCIEHVCGIGEVNTMDRDEAVSKGLLTFISSDVDKEYYRALKEMAKRPDLIEKHAEHIHLVYTPLFGTGLRTFKGVMEKLPYKYTLAETQCMPDPEFPGLKAPNPEDPAAMEIAIELARNTGADIAIGTDPDADRMGAAIRNDSGEFVMLSGNQIGCLISEYLLRQSKERGELAAGDYIVKSFVSTAMAESIAAGLGAECITVPTGFKYIADVINTRKRGKFVFGFEESCGFLADDFVADKDGIMALLLLLEVICECADRGETLYQRLVSLYETYGWHKEKVTSTVLSDGGMGKKEEIMQCLRQSAPETLGGQRVVATTDYLSGIRKEGERETLLDFPRENALKFELESGWVAVRPSGTEPKIKLYAAVNGKTKQASEMLLDALYNEASALIGG